MEHGAPPLAPAPAPAMAATPPGPSLRSTALDSSQHPPPPPHHSPGRSLLPLPLDSWHHGHMPRSHRAIDNIGAIYYSFNNQEKFLNGLSSDDTHSFITKLCTNTKLSCLTENDTLSAISTFSVKHPEILALNVPGVMSSIIKMLRGSGGSIIAISDVVKTIAIECSDHMEMDNGKTEMLISICAPLTDCLMSGNSGLSVGSATALAEIVKSRVWQSASLGLIISVCHKASTALQDINFRTVAHVHLAYALAEMNSSTLKVYGSSVIDSCLVILDGCMKLRSQDMALNCIQMLHCLLEEMDVNIQQCQLSSIVDAFKNYEDNYCSVISNAAVDAGKLAKDLWMKLMVLEPVDSNSQAASKHDSKAMPFKRPSDMDTGELPFAKQRKLAFEEHHESSNHQLFMCPSDKSHWISLHTYAKQNEDDITYSLHTPGSRENDPHFQTLTSNEVKIILRRAYHKMKDVNDSGLTFDGQLSARNIMIDDYNSVKFGCLESGQLKKFTDEGGDEDSHTFVHMVKREVFQSSKSPQDISKWLELIDECEPKNDELAKYNISTMDEHAAVTCFFSMVDALDEMDKVAHPVYTRVTKKLEETKKYSNWQTVIGETYGNKYLSMSMKYRSDEGLDPYTDDIAGLLLMLRNSRQHSAKWVEEYFLNIICQHHPDLPADLQRAMHGVGYLPRLLLKYSMP